jgi:hypothetical protein
MSESELAAEVRALRKELARIRMRPRRHHVLGKIVKGFEEDPVVQARVHLYGCIYWLINFPIIAALFFGWPSEWIKVGLLVNTFYSLYANLATDYDGLSSSQASLHAREATAAARNREDSTQ